MSEWIDLTIYAALIAAVWFMLPAWSARFAMAFAADRNREWLAAHPDVTARLTRLSGFRWTAHAWGVFSLAVLMLFQWDLLPHRAARIVAADARWESLKDLNSTLVLVGLVYYVAAAVLFTRRLNRTVPLAERREATLARRSLDDFVPRQYRIVAYGFAGLIMLVWIATGVMGAYSTPAFWGRFAFLAALTPIFGFFVWLAVNRPPNVMDRVLGPGFRASEVRWGFAMHLIPPVLGLISLYEEVTGTLVPGMNRATHLGVVVIVIAWMWRIATRTRHVAPDGSGGARLLRAH